MVFVLGSNIEALPFKEVRRMKKCSIYLLLTLLMIILATLAGCKSNAVNPSAPTIPQVTEPTVPANQPVTPTPPAPTPIPAPAGDKTLSWWFTRNSLHQVPTTNSEVVKLLAADHAFYVLPNDRKKIYLTFDCGYELGYTPTILDVLDRQQVRACFFITGQFIKTQPELVKRMKSSGHLVGNHTFNHPDLPTLSQAKFNQEITSLEQRFTEITGSPIDRYLRPPNGTYSAATLAWAHELGYTTVFWSIALVDWDPNKQPGTAYVHQQVLDNIHPGAVILLHVVSQSDTEALEGIITALKAQGYVFSTFTL
jgi:peptidoglycan-N-acetylmuramic acid deacetylase